MRSIVVWATKLRALLQRRKNGDIFDLHIGLQKLSLNPDMLLACSNHNLTPECKVYKPHLLSNNPRRDPLSSLFRRGPL
jgi:hypothetical protein